MKSKFSVCRRCGHEEKITIYSQEDAQRHRLRLVPPRCSKCGSTDVQLYD